MLFIQSEISLIQGSPVLQGTIANIIYITNQETHLFRYFFVMTAIQKRTLMSRTQPSKLFVADPPPQETGS